MPRVEKLDPRKTTVHDHRLNPDAVKFYEANPRGRYHNSGGVVVAQRDANGNVHIYNGAHRRQAAINTGRKLEAVVYGPDERLPGCEPGQGCMGVVVVALLGGAGTLGWAAVELTRAIVGA